MTAPGLTCGSTASKAGISGRVLANRFDCARSAMTAIVYCPMFCWCTMLLPRHAEAQRRRVHRHEHIESSLDCFA